MAKQILFKEGALNKLASGAKKLNDAVTITMGAKGQNVLIDDGFGSKLPHVTKDGVTVAKSVELKDIVENLAATLIKHVALKTNDTAGDGTTTATCLANAIFQYGRNAIVKDGVHPIMLKRGLDIQVKEVVKELEKYAVSIDKIEDTYKVAYISSNGDEDIARLVTDVYKLIGKDGNVAIEISSSSNKSTFEKVEGIKFDRGYNNPYFVNNPKMTADYSNPLILICDYVINDINEIQGLLKLVSHPNKKRPLLIICEDIDVRAEEKLIINKMNGALDVVVVKAPEFGDRRLDYLEDIAILTGGVFVSNLTGITLNEIKAEHLGQCDRIIIDNENTTIVGGQGSVDKLEERIQHIKERVESTQDDQKKYQEKRYARIQGGVVVIKVGGDSDVEKIELKDRVEDSVNAVKSSLIEGIIPGGGIPLLRIGDKGFRDTDLSKNSTDINKGRLVLLQAIKIPFRTIIGNAGLPVEELEKDTLKKSKNVVFDVMSETFKDGFKYGIIDPLLVTKTALINAVSVAGTLLTTGCTISYEPDNAAPVDFNLPSGR